MYKLFYRKSKAEYSACSISAWHDKQAIENNNRILVTVASALARLHTRSVYGSLDLFGTFCGNAKKYIKECNCYE
jgi:hypothetical protein